MAFFWAKSFWTPGYNSNERRDDYLASFHIIVPQDVF